MFRLPLIFSFLLHLGIAIAILKYNHVVVRLVTKVEALTEKEFKKLEKRIAQTSDNDATEEEPKDSRFMTKKNHKVEKETKAKKTDKFKNIDKGKEDTEIPPGGEGFLPSKKSKLKKGGDSSTDDDLGDMTIGPSTLINGKEYKFFGYYERIREQVVTRWRTKIRKAIEVVKHQKEKAKEPFTAGSKITILLVTLNPKGELTNIEDLGRSGIDEFDISAREAFRESSPFAHPPDELIKDGSFTIKWTFTVNVEEPSLIGSGGDRR